MAFFTWNPDPVLVSLGAFSIHWYGVLFGAAIMFGFTVMKGIFQRENKSIELLDSLLMYTVAGIIIGARLAHCFFYDPGYFLSNPIDIFKIWQGGLSSHGGGAGVLIAIILFCKKHQINYLWLVDRLAIPTALFGVFVRCANFVNSEILGRVTDVSWAVIFERIDMQPRHPAQLYEAIAYLIIFIGLSILYKAKDGKPQPGALFGWFLISLFSARFFIELFKERQASYAQESLLSTGQMLSVPFILAGVFLLVKAYKKAA